MSMQAYVFYFVLFFYGMVAGLRSWLLYRQTGINPFKLKRNDTAHGFQASVFSAIAISALVVSALYSFGGNWYDYLVPIWYVEQELFQWIGLGLSTLALIVIWMAQGQMAASWRIGIDSSEKTELIQRGLFRFSRNPIFLAILISYLGFFLMVPNAVTLALGAVSYVSIQTQVRLEEAYLEETHGENYWEYKSRVRRWG